MKELLIELIENRVLIIALVAWAAAQVIKALLYLVINRKFDFERLVGSGGMPSSHAATVWALMLSIGFEIGMDTPEFALAAVLAAVVLHDARGVRLETGKQAQTITAITDFLKKGTAIELPELELKELVGHTPLQVAVGSAIGILTAILMRG